VVRLSRYVVDIASKEIPSDKIANEEGDLARENGKRRSLFKTVLITLAGLMVAALLACSTGSYFYWQHLKSTPEYSLALIVDAAKRDDPGGVNDLVDINAVVDDFLPQVTSKAVELYGRGLPPDVIRRVERIAAPVMPAVKDRAREELPGAIRQKTSVFGNVPFAAMVLGAGSYLDIKVDGDRATVRSKLPEHDFELSMVRNGERWKIAGVRDDELATRIARRIGQEIVAIATNGSGSNKGRLGIKNINELLREAEDILR
jgi:hypothetical protein